MRSVRRDTVWTRTLFRARLWLAARLLPFRIANKSLPQILALYGSSDSEALPPFPADYVERSVRWAVRRPLLMRNRRCFRSGLLAYEVLRRAGYEPKLHFSVSSDAAVTERVEAHCWVSIADRPVVNQPKAGHILLFTHPRQPVGARQVA